MLDFLIDVYSTIINSIIGFNISFIIVLVSMMFACLISDMSNQFMSVVFLLGGTIYFLYTHTVSVYTFFVSGLSVIVACAGVAFTIVGILFLWYDILKINY